MNQSSRPQSDEVLIQTYFQGIVSMFKTYMGILIMMISTTTFAACPDLYNHQFTTLQKGVGCHAKNQNNQGKLDISCPPTGQQKMQKNQTTTQKQRLYLQSVTSAGYTNPPLDLKEHCIEK